VVNIMMPKKNASRFDQITGRAFMTRMSMTGSLTRCSHHTQNANDSTTPTIMRTMGRLSHPNAPPCDTMISKRLSHIASNRAPRASSRWRERSSIEAGIPTKTMSDESAPMTLAVQNARWKSPRWTTRPTMTRPVPPPSAAIDETIPRANGTRSSGNVRRRMT